VAVFLRRIFRMMDYTLFKELVNDKFMEYMPEEFKHGELRINKVNRINGTKDGLNIYLDGAKGAPTIYVDDMYKSFKDSGSLEDAFQEAADLYTMALRELPPIPVSSVTEGAQDKIYMVLINTESNKDILNNAPHREVNDTSVIYRIMVSDDERGPASTLITNDIAKVIGMSEEELFKIAVENTPKLFPPVVMPLSSMVTGILSEEGGMPENVADQAAERLRGESELMWIISNNRGVSGAVNMLFEKNLNELSKELGDDLYILPSSIHEVIAIPASLAVPEDLAEMVHQVNSEVVDESERLSNQVYHYDRAERKLSMATDSPNRGVTNEVAEVGFVYDTEQKR
jgi:hypothetical protein